MSKVIDWSKRGYEDLKRMFFAERPREVDGVANASALFYRKKLLRLLFGRFEFSGFPEKWDKEYFLLHLFCDGEICITDTPLGVLPLECGHTGLNVFNRPTECVISNPQIGNLRRTITYADELTYYQRVGIDNMPCAHVYINFDYSGIMPLIDRFAYMFASVESAFAVNLMNSKVAVIALAANKAQAETMKKMYDDISMGKPAVFVKADQVSGENFFFNRVKEQFIAGDLQTVKRTLTNEFLTEIGVNNANLDKRERLNAEEVRANDDEIKINVKYWLDNINKCFDVANRLYNLSLSVRLAALDTEENIETEEDAQNESE